MSSSDGFCRWQSLPGSISSSVSGWCEDWLPVSQDRSLFSCWFNDTCQPRGVQTTSRANPLAQKILAAYIAQGHTNPASFYAPDNCKSTSLQCCNLTHYLSTGVFLNDTQMPPTFNYNNPSVPFPINGRTDPQSIRFHVRSSTPNLWIHFPHFLSGCLYAIRHTHPRRSSVRSEVRHPPNSLIVLIALLFFQGRRDRYVDYYPRASDSDVLIVYSYSHQRELCLGVCSVQHDHV